MATCSNYLAWKIPRTRESGGLQSMGLQKVRHKLATKQQYHDLKYASTFIGHVKPTPKQQKKDDTC